MFIHILNRMFRKLFALFHLFGPIQLNNYEKLLMPDSVTEIIHPISIQHKHPIHFLFGIKIFHMENIQK